MNKIIEINGELFGHIGPAGQQEQEPKEEPKKKKGKDMSDKKGPPHLVIIIAAILTGLAISKMMGWTDQCSITSGITNSKTTQSQQSTQKKEQSSQGLTKKQAGNYDFYVSHGYSHEEALEKARNK